MCGPSKPPGPSPAELEAQARREEEARQQQILQGETAINEAFAPFDDSYFDGLRQDRLSFYRPQLNEQRTDALEQLKLGLASRGMLNSSIMADRVGDIQQQFDTQRQNIVSQADAGVLDARSRIENQRAELVRQNRASADPAAAAASAAAAAQRLQVPQTLSPLGAVFANALNLGGRAVTANNEGRDVGKIGSVVRSALSGSPQRVVTQ